MKVLHIITAINAGGAETMLCKYLENSGGGSIQHVVLSLMPPGPKAARIRAMGIPIYNLGMKSWLPGPVAAVRLIRLVNMINPDLIHGWMYHGNLAASFAHTATAAGRPLVWNVRHSLADAKLETRRTQALLKVSAAMSRRPAAIIYNSAVAATQHQQIGYCPDRALVLPNGFDFDLFRPNPQARGQLNVQYGIDPEALLVGMVARLHPMKDHSMLIDAAALARSQGADIHLLMVGEGLADPPASLLDKALALLPAERFTFVGNRPDVADLLAGLDILGLSSAWGEGFPNVIGEALACGVPVVATDVGDSAAIVADSGIITAPGDAEAFGNALVEMDRMGAPSRKALGARGRVRALENYSLQEIAMRYDELHHKLVSQRSFAGKTIGALAETSGATSS